MRLDKVFSKNSIFPTYFYAVSMMVILFKLTWLDVLFILLLDSLVFAILKPIDYHVFYALFPKFKPFKENLEAPFYKATTFEEQLSLFERLSMYPEIRCIYVFVISLFKVLPVGFYVSYNSPIASSFISKLGMFYISDGLVLTFFHALLFIHLHEISSSFFAKLKEEPGWKENYWRIRLPFKQDRFYFIQNASLTLMIINLLTISYIITTVETIKSHDYLFIFFSAALICIGYIQYYFQKFFRDSLKSMFNYLNQDFTKKNIEVLPLHTSPLLAGFESTVNQLGHNLQMREQEIQEWLRYESEQFHLRSLGEITALVAHDIKTPLHVMQMSLEMINDPKSSPDTVAKYKYILERNLTQTISFTATLMSYLRGEGDDSGCSFTEVHLHLIDLFKTQYPEDIFSRIDFQLAAEVTNLELKSSRMDTMHIFYNLYQNAIRSVLQDHKEKPVISIWVEKNNDVAQIYIRDNGQGLSLEKFNLLTAFEQTTKNGNFKKGLGLRITKTILSYHKGELELIPTDNGACFKVSIPAKESYKKPLAIEDSPSTTFQ